MNRRQMHRLAGASALLAIPTLLLSAVFLALFSGDAGRVFGPLNDLFVAATTGLLILPANALRDCFQPVGFAAGDGWR